MSKDRDNGLSPLEKLVHAVIVECGRNGEVATNEQIYAAVRGRPLPEDRNTLTNYVDQLVYRLRKHLPPDEIKTVHGYGYFSESVTKKD